MCDQIKNASIEWQDERTPISKKFDDKTGGVYAINSKEKKDKNR